MILIKSFDDTFLLIQYSCNTNFYFQYDKEQQDCRRRTPLMLAVTLGYTKSVEVLLNHDANVYTENTQGWSGKLEKIFFNLLI